MALTVEFLTMIGREGGYQRAKVLSPKKRKRIALKAANSRWAGLSAEERKAERAKGRESKLDKEPAQKKMAAKA
jgi:hypothetical protein